LDDEENYHAAWVTTWRRAQLAARRRGTGLGDDHGAARRDEE